MGTYTCFFMNTRLKPETPDAVIQTLKWMAMRGIEPEEWFAAGAQLPSLDHPLFETPRWDMLFLGGGPGLDEFPPLTSAMIEEGGGYRLVAQSCINRADDEIRQFCDWIGPFVDADPGSEIGATVCSAEDTLGTIIYDRDTLVLIVKDYRSTSEAQAAVKRILGSGRLAARPDI